MTLSPDQTGASEDGSKQASGGAGAAQRPASAAGSLTEMVAAPPAVSFTQSFTQATLIKIGVLAGLLALLNYRYGIWLVKKWLSDADWTHGFVIPLFSIYLLYARREDLFSARRRSCLWGLPILLLFLAGEILGFYPIRNYWFGQICMIGVLFALVLYLAGTSTIRVTWLPVLFLIFAIPISPMLYTRISLPLQNLSAKGAVLILRLLQVRISSSASALTLTSKLGVERDLTVAEACSGMRLLMAFLALGVAMAYLEYKPIWQRVVLVLAAIPIAIFCNVLRVAITSYMFYLDKPEFGQKFMHHFTGMLMLVPAFAMLWLLAWILRWIHRHAVLEEPTRAGERTPAEGGE